MTGNGGPDWASTFAEFHDRHRDPKSKKKLVYTAVFNAAMEAFMVCPEVPLDWRVLAYIWRYSWGNSSDYCVDEIGGHFVGQLACAKKLGVDNRRVNDSVGRLRELYFVLPSHGHKLYPVDDPAQAASQTDNPENPKYPVPSGYFADFCAEWKIRSLADFNDLESAEATVNRIKKNRLGEYRVWRRDRIIHAMPIGTNVPTLGEAQVPAEPPVPPPPSSPAPPVSKPKQTTTTTTAALPPDDVVVIAEKLAVTNTAAQDFLSKCRSAAPGCALQDIVACLDEVDATIDKARYNKNPTGILLTSVPSKLLASIKQRTEMEAKAKTNLLKCWVCGKPITGGSVERAHFECYATVSEERAVGAAND